MTLKAIAWPDIERVARKMCELHRHKVCLTAFTDDPVAAISYMATKPLVGVTVWKDDEPVAVCGAVITHPNVASTFFFGTDDWPKRFMEIHKFFTRNLRQALAHAGVHRVSILSPADDPEGERWKRMGGCTLEATLKGFGKGGEDFSLFRVDL